MASLNLSPSLGARVLLLGSFVFTAGCVYTSPRPATPAATTPVASPTRGADGAFDDDPRPPTASESAVIAAGLDPARLATVERDLLAVLRDPSSSPALKQDAAQQLGLAILAGSPDASSATLSVLAPMLSDPARVDYARLVLDRVPGSQVDALYLQALSATSGRAGLGIIDSIGARAIGEAIPALGALLNDTDRATAAAAASALGQIGGSAALDALAKSEHPLDPAVLNGRLAAAATADTSVAAQVAGDIYRNSAAPLPQRAAALRSLIAANPTGAVEEIHTALLGAEAAFHAVAIESISSLPVAAKLADRLGTYPPAVEVPLITALGFRGDAAAISGVTGALANADEGVRLAAIEALGRLPGNAEVVQQLATLATGKGDSAKAAFASLARLDGPIIDEIILVSARSEEDLARRSIFIQQLAARNQTEAISFLFGLRSSPEETIRLEALDALRAIAAPADQPPIIAWALAASRAEQSRAVRALITIILRDGAVATRADTVITALKVGDSAARLALLPVLSRAGGDAARAAAGTLAQDGDEAVALAAANELARWPDATALPVLVDVAVRTQGDALRDAAVRGATRFLVQRNGLTSAQRSEHARALLDLPLATPARVALINVLSLCADQPALATAQRFLADPATAEVARDAVDAITSNQAGAPVITASVDSAGAALMADGDTGTYWQVPVEIGLWLRADLHNSRPVRKITLDHNDRGWGYPGKVDLQVSNDPEQPGEAVAQGEGERSESVFLLPAGTRGRFVWIRVTGLRDAPMAVAEFLVE